METNLVGRQASMKVTLEKVVQNMITQSASFEAMRNNLQINKPPVLLLQPRKVNNRPLRRGPRSPRDSVDFARSGRADMAESTSHRSQPGTLISSNNPAFMRDGIAVEEEIQTSITHHNTPREEIDRVYSTPIHDTSEEETIAIITYDGSFEMLDNRPSRSDTVSTPGLLADLDNTYAGPSEMSDTAVNSEFGSEFPLFSESEDIDIRTVTDVYQQSSTLTI